MSYHSCPGRCGRQITGKLFACPECWGRLPGDMQAEIRVSRLVDMARHFRAQSDARGWFDAQLPAGHREVTSAGTTQEWTGSMWRQIPRSELDREGWRRSRGELP